MSSAVSMPPHAATYEALTGQSSTLEKPLPTTVDMPTGDDVREALRAEKANRRESRIGLRSIFGRSKASKNTPTQPSPQRLSRVPGPGVRASMAGPPSQQFSYHASPSSKSAAIPTTRPLPTMVEDVVEPSHVLPVRVPEPASAKSKPSRAAPKPARTEISSMDAPPLNKAYPQAVIYSTLSSPSIPADLILRAYERRGSGNSHEDQSTIAEGADANGDDKAKVKKKHRRNKSGSGINLDWTTKIYVLAMSGYLLEYAGEGPADRTPEKSLRLTKDSAAFVSDLIPGRHWVLQVASVMGSDGVSSVPDSKSIFSRFPFRAAPDKRMASNMLLVFENAEDMDGWLATARRAIEAMGGKKGLTETGKPKEENPISPLRDQTSHRTLIGREQNRQSRTIIPEEFQWDQGSARRESDGSFSVSDATREQSMDEISTTNSVISHDGQQLESLRGSANRLSFISSGQRTVITSAGSSPACSPTVENFPMQPEEPARRPRDSIAAESRLRPNASAIAERRKSLQTMQSNGPFVDMRSNMASSRPQSIMAGSTPVEPIVSAGVIPAPNFSVPRSSNRRFSSTARMSIMESNASLSPPRDDSTAGRGTARRPPTALRITRPLSMVVDQPSPKEGVPDRPATRHGDGRQPIDVPGARSQHTQYDSHPLIFETAPPMEAIPHSLPANGDAYTSPRRLSSMGALRAVQAPHSLGPADWYTEAPLKARSRHSAQIVPVEMERSHSSTGAYERTTGMLSPPPTGRVSKRVSMHSFIPDRSLPLRTYEGVMPFISEPPAQTSPPPTGPLPPIPNSAGSSRLRVDKPLGNRRSMPQLADGPPQAPPPLCALPPVPPKKSPGRYKA